MSKTACEYNWYDTGRQAFYDNSTFETLKAMYPLAFYDDFNGAWTALPPNGTPQSGCPWVLKDVSAAGTPTGEVLADETNGVIQLALAANVEVETMELHMNDNLQFSWAQG